MRALENFCRGELKVAKTFQDLSIADLVQIHNTAPGVKPVKTFRTKGDAQKRVLQHFTEADALKRLDGVDGVEVEEPGSKVDVLDLLLTDPRHPLYVSPEEKARREEARKVAPPAPSLRAISVVPEHQKINGAVPEKAARKKRKDQGALIIVIAAEANPHREKSAAGQRFSLFQSGQTVDDFVAAWAAVPGQKNRLDKKRARRARRQVRKDAAKGHIKLVTRGEWEKLQASAKAE
jgi:hypothetical protein